MDIKIILLAIMFSVNSWADTGSQSECTNNSNYEYSACIRLKYIEITKILNTLLNQYNKLLSNTERELLEVSSNSWGGYKDALCKLENYSNLGTSGWQSNIDECISNKIKLRIIEIQKLIDYKNEDKEPL